MKVNFKIGKWMIGSSVIAGITWILSWVFYAMGELELVTWAQVSRNIAVFVQCVSTFAFLIDIQISDAKDYLSEKKKQKEKK